MPGLLTSCKLLAFSAKAGHDLNADIPELNIPQTKQGIMAAKS